MRARLMESGPDPAPEERWPGIGERVRIRPLGLWPDGGLRLSGRPSCVDRMPIANTKQDKPLLIRLATETDDPRGARIPGGLESDCAL